jgi:hypothetical protein
MRADRRSGKIVSLYKREAGLDAGKFQSAQRKSANRYRQCLTNRRLFWQKNSYICIMATLNIEILNPKAKKLLQDLAELRLISISEKTSSPFFYIIKKLRSKKADVSLDEITKEVEAVRTKRYGK